MRKLGHLILPGFIVLATSACSYNITPAVPAIPPRSGAHALSCKAILLIPEEFKNREYVSSFEGREIRITVGPPASGDNVKSGVWEVKVKRPLC